MSKFKSILVYCGANAGTKPIYKQVAEELGHYFVKQGIRLIYGGGSLGLMGAISKTIMDHGGEVTGIIPHFLDRLEVGNPDLTEVIKVETMHERKALMEKRCDAIVTLPGGYGSMDEIFEMLSWSQLGLHNKPVAILNVNGFYDILLQQLDHMVAEGFLKQQNRDLLIVANTIEDLFEKLDSFEYNFTVKW
ncbi:MAG: TIGR00730 family Rossman fold protein [Leadbetterella sp.]